MNSWGYETLAVPPGESDLRFGVAVFQHRCCGVGRFEKEPHDGPRDSSVLPQREPSQRDPSSAFRPLPHDKGDNLIAKCTGTQNRGKTCGKLAKDLFLRYRGKQFAVENLRQGQASEGMQTLLFAGRAQGLAISQGVRIVNRDRRYQAECQTPALLHSNPV